ncbi:MAG: hypothetical protein SPJ92_02485 [Bariatricus sp.]|nr:hypothetical protein [Bariatricus sp.]
MSSETSMVAASFRLQEWAAQIKECQSRPSGMSVASWCADNGITEIPKHLDDTDRRFLEDLLPSSPNLPEICRKPDKKEVK